MIELGLLLQEVFGSRLGGLELEREMHAFVAAILLRMAGFDALDGDAEAEPPHRQSGEIEQGVDLQREHRCLSEWLTASQTP